MTSHTAQNMGASPQSVEKITRIAQDYEYNPLIPLRNWLRTASTLIREARIYEREGHDEQTYLLLFRHAQLVLVNLAKHPEAKDEKYRKALMEAEKEVQINLGKLEALKPRINKRYERFVQLMRERQSRTPSHETSSGSLNQTQPYDPALAGVVEPLEAGKNRDLAVQLARTEISRRATVRKALRQAGVSPGEDQSRRTVGDWGNRDDRLDKNGPDTDNDLRRRIQDVRLNIDQQAHTGLRQPQQNKTVVRPPTSISSTSTYKYPTVPRQRPLESLPSTVTKSSREKLGLRSEPPLLPPKELPGSNRPAPAAGLLPPPLPGKISPAPAPAVPEKASTTADSGNSGSGLDPSSFTFKPSAYLENGTPLRTMWLPPELRTHFLAVAASNTRRNLETCGILCGTLISNALFVSRLLIPEQTATSDTCETVNETAIFDYCDSEDLMVLGWIHTHPTQTCFMSSRDLHTHCGYQVMLPESIAIVCAPSKSPDWGVFRLTDPPGLKTVLNCTQTGLFHPHAEANIYTDALRPGHVFEAKGLEFETVDLRPNGS
ncbi:putative endosome-associated ubiquitin isopeptidase (AmsH) [Aspergillus clavatus NRRL 1]|uniref:Endosome-associated ubiquitin isopeptidase (AmsH), putative n=1 Tax=Aspergillus clavatus (strain ATCC 1007 / CBS 513.65 / DSM 816 / NCTC 3887 / NRRL 1 / QM 1276 / 107) TaxID=344612 RepID=A1CJZ2_ASPCL|nr:endosome-associated ubiquitin isopeptidase (AmsH), putative [Aspergillus clavatus NRRL 1]EAW09466.1 endosome-associated ubiquitin isopeptidase (AmsH), putative [Aspergillus clavatus NRRL 1]